MAQNPSPRIVVSPAQTVADGRPPWPGRTAALAANASHFFTRRACLSKLPVAWSGEMKIAIAALALILATPAFGQTATDGDTIKLNGTTWRLWGIDAPELHQTCKDGWAAGIKSKRTLERLMRQSRFAAS